MSMYYEQDMNLREIGSVMGVTESRVCQLHSQAVARLRSKLKNCRAAHTCGTPGVRAPHASPSTRH